MDYFYSKLNEQVKKVEYKGAITETAVVTVDNRCNLISVDVRALSPDILNIPQPTEPDKYVLQETFNADNTRTYQWVSKEVFSADIQEQITNITLQLEQAQANLAGAINKEIEDRKAGDAAVAGGVNALTVMLVVF